VKAKKSFGQHFLNNENIAKNIAYGLLRTDGVRNVLEIGPGRGVLTKYLLEQDIDLKVVEADRDMIAYLEKHYSIPQDDIIFLDFLKLNLTKVFDNNPFYIIGNYPYNISSQILIKMINHHELVPEMVGMFQKEVADRVISPPGSKVYGGISVMVQLYYEGEELMKIDPSSFTPPPKVDSSVIRLTHRKDLVLDFDEKLFRQVVKTSFGQRRKMLRNTLKSLIGEHSFIEDTFLTKRPEHLSVEDFIFITKTIEEINNLEK
jgi:16S rRNA (adenine1518-N6/adenine1519-N6)-dimethyltransferase